MERRKLLIGSGAALTTALAGCFGSDDDGDDDPEEGLEDSGGTDDDNGDDDHDDNDDDHDDDDDDDDDKYHDVPGFDAEEFDLESDLVTVEHVKHDGEKVDVEVTTKTTDTDELYDEFKPLAKDIETSTYDFDRFKGTVSRIEMTIVDDKGTTVAAFYVNVDWIRKYLEGKLTDDEFLDLVLATME